MLDAERSLFNAQLSYTQTQGDVFTSMVGLYKAMGGGWVTDAEHDRHGVRLERRAGLFPGTAGAAVGQAPAPRLQLRPARSAAMSHARLIACHECDLLQHETVLPQTAASRVAGAATRSCTGAGPTA